ncbi:MAG: hypothetical protein IJ111_07295 [Eggerthellaceae bacterium]|nr:hypothetical protein [Eggerthellaceae bacterium]
MATSYKQEALRVNVFNGGILPKVGVFEIEDKRIILYTGIPGTKSQKRTVIKFRDIEAVYPMNVWGISPTGVIIVMKDSTSYRFGLSGRKEFLPWLEERVAACQPKGNKKELPDEDDEE